MQNTELNNKLNLVKKRKFKSKLFYSTSLFFVFILMFSLLCVFSSIFKTAMKKFIISDMTTTITTNDIKRFSQEYEYQYIDERVFKKLILFKLKSLSPEVSKEIDDLNYSLIFSSKGIEKQVQNVKTFVKGDDVDGKTTVTLQFSGKMNYKYKQGHYSIYENLLNALKDRDMIHSYISLDFFKSADSRRSEMAGFLTAMYSSFLVMLVFLPVSFIISIFTALYLEEYAKRGKISSAVEIAIGNLASVPSVVFGLLGMMLFIEIFGLPRSSSLVGGFTLAMLSLPIMIVSFRSAIKSVPQYIRDAAIVMGASKTRVSFGIVLPSCISGIISGTLLTVGRVIGETAPLLIVGMFSFISAPPSSFTEPAVPMPVQIYLWSSMPEQSFVENASLGAFVLISVLFLINVASNLAREKFEVQW